MFIIIAAIGKNRAIGSNNQLLFHIKDDMRFFRTTTTGHKVVMGRKTWESLPQKLENRINIVLTHQNIAEADQCIDDVGAFIRANVDSPEEIFVIGGSSVYEQFLTYADIMYLTEIDAIPAADRFFPNFNKKSYRKKILQSGEQDGLSYKIVKYWR